MSSQRVSRKRWPWIVGAIVGLLLIPVAVVAIPIITHSNQGVSIQERPTDDWPLDVVADGGDDRTRELSVAAEPSAEPLDTSALVPGQRLIVSGSGYDGSRGIYVAICVIPASPDIKPGPCIGGVPDQVNDEVEAGTVQFAPSNWINDDWAWKLFGARSFDDLDAGTFTAYIEVGDPVGDEFDCRAQACGVFTRNDHTALTDRVQDVYVPVGFSKP